MEPIRMARAMQTGRNLVERSAARAWAVDSWMSSQESLWLANLDEGKLRISLESLSICY